MRMRLKFGLGQPHRAVGVTNDRIDAAVVRLSHKVRANRIFIRQRQGADRLLQVALDRQTHHRLVRADHSPGLIHRFLQSGLQRPVTGNGLGRISGALQGEQILLHIFFGFDLCRDVYCHGKAGLAPQV